ncbi:hypothetical protein EHS25_006765 [Saitozyma podzolica]|uniref:Uncharacterized protein n=1 Tax=Saitozyma podzolica TaxID=1890683 RepID=A0A427YSW9_9TREE|nr:hypothetical protein EHS25_006765 [Saitozyma podzolica]
MGIAGDYDDPRIWSALERICLAAKSASTPAHQVYVGLGGLEPRPDLLERLRGEFDNIRAWRATAFVGGTPKAHQVMGPPSSPPGRTDQASSSRHDTPASTHVYLTKPPQTVWLPRRPFQARCRASPRSAGTKIFTDLSFLPKAEIATGLPGGN